MTNKKVVSSKIANMMERSSWIRRMFDEGTELKAKYGADKVFDFTLGNPIGEPPEEVRQKLWRLVSSKPRGHHRYMPNAGFPEVRTQVAQALTTRSGKTFTHDHIIMTCGAGGALNVILKALIDPGDEVVIVAPYFAEYLFYIDNHQGKPVITQTDDRFELVPELIEKVLSDQTRVVILNSPNNPTGAVYSAESLAAVGDVLTAASEKYGHPIYLVMDEPYRKIIYEGVTVPDAFAAYTHTIVATSHSKDLNLPGERIGYIAIGPENDDIGQMAAAMTMANRILGFVNAPALFQRLAGDMQEVVPDMTTYTANRKILLAALHEAGAEVVEPMGGFYLFPKAPNGQDFELIDALKRRKVLVVPGTGFGWPGNVRISYCVDTTVCEKAAPLIIDAFTSLVPN
jgi:aspartate aminotransferase